MRRLPTEVKSQGDGGAARLGMRALAAAKRSRLRRLTMESLEERALMATNPVSVASGQVAITNNGKNSNTNDSSPFIAIDPLDPLKMVTVYTDRNTNNTPNVQTRASFSNNGGVSWTAIPVGGFSSPSLTSVLGDPTSSTGAPFAEDRGMGVTFDRKGNFYIARLEDNGSGGGGSAGDVILQKFSFTGATPVNVAGNSGNNIVVYAWNQTVTNQNRQPSIFNFSVAADSNFGSYTDPVTNQQQNDPSTNNVYVAWTSFTPPPSSPPSPYNPYSIEIAGSADGVNWSTTAPSRFGQDTATPVAGNSFGQVVTNARLTAAQLAISQGTSTIADVQTMTFAAAPTTGNVQVTFTNPITNVSQAVQIPLNSTAATVQSLIDPIFGAGNVVVTGSSAPGSKLKFTSAGVAFAGKAIQLATIGGGSTATIAHTVTGSLGKGAVGGQITVIYDDFGSAAGASPPFDIISASTLTFAGGNFTTLTSQSQVATTIVTGAVTVPTSGFAPGAQIASDNTLGSFSQHEGTLYVTYLDRSRVTGTPANANRIALVSSTDGGATWSSPVIVNDDLATSDGYSASTGTTVRPKFEPAIAVDNVTGTVVVSWLDMRDDASVTRYANYISTSIDGGKTFSPNSFTNAPNTVTDGITGKSVVVGPESDISTEGSLSFGTHQAVAIANGFIYPVWSGTMTTVSGRLLSDGYNGQQLGIDFAKATYANGPRIISGTMGPVALQTASGNSGSVTFNNSFTVDGTPRVDGFAVTFDRPVLISSFTAADVIVKYHDTTTALPGGYTTIALDPLNPIQALDANQTFVSNTTSTLMATKFFVRFATPQSAIGTYSYSVGPNITDQSRTATATSGSSTQNFPGTTVPATINDSPLATSANSAITVSGIAANQTVSKVTVGVNINYLHDTDLVLTLIAPNGQSVILSNQRGGNGSNYTNTVFDSTSGSPISGGTAPFTGTFAPDGSLTVLNGMTGIAANGAWTLSVQDKITGAVIVGAITNWSLSITRTAAVGGPFTNAFTSNTIVPIPSVNSTINVGGFTANQSITKVTANVSVTYPQDGDLQLVLVAPNGATSLLSNKRGGAGANFVTTVFDDAGTTAIGAGTAPFTGTFTPDSPLSVFNGTSGSAADGGWSLLVLDSNTGRLLPGAITNWSVTISVTSSTGTGTTTFNSTAAVPFNTTYPAPTTSMATVSGIAASQSVTKVAVNVDSLTYPADGDIRLTLTSPSGVTVILSDFRGANGANFTNTVFDSTSLNPIGAGTNAAPYTGTFSPDGDLSIYNGQSTNANGVWVLTVYNKKADGTISTGSIVSWSLSITTQNFGATTTSAGQTMDQNANGVLDTASTSDVFSVPTPLGSTPFTAPYDTTTLPIIVPGPHMVSSFATFVDASGVSHKTTSTDNLALNGTVSSIDVTFDRNMDPTSFTAAQILSLMGPIGPVSGPFTVTPDPQAGENASFPRTYKISFATQQISGTYTVTLGAGLKSQAGDLVDTNQNAGVDLIFGVQTGSTKTLAINGSPTAGAVNVTFTNPSNSRTLTVSIPFNATATQVQTLINPLYGAGNIIVSGGALPTNPLVFNTSGTLSNLSVPSLIIGTSSLNNGATATTASGATTNTKYLQDTTKSYNTPDVPITPANGTIQAGTAVTSSITVNDSFNITGTALGLDLTYPKDSELTATLSFTPNGSLTPAVTVTLFSGVGGNGANFTGTTLNDAPTSTPIANGVAPFSGAYNPANPLSAFNGLLAQGKFTLTITTSATTANVGLLNSWGVTLSKSANITVPAAPPVVPPTTPATYTPTSITSTITVTDPSVIQGTQVGLSIVYPTDPNLTATLTFTPADTSVNPITVTLFSGVGAVGSSQNGQANFTNTIFSDAASTPIANGAAPFTGLFNPASPLSVLNGLSGKGVYTLTVTNNGPNSGTLTSFTLTITKTSPIDFSTGLGETVADQSSASFRIFTMDPTNAIASNTWTAVGGASNNSTGNSGRIGGLAVDPSDPSGNTVFVAGASGGIWVTHNFLTTSSNGPTYIPLTDAAATNGINIGSIAVFGRNNDPRQSIVIAGTGEGDTTSPGVGFLISYNGGATWNLMDSLNNYTSAGVEIPRTQRDLNFVGLSTFKVIVDPHLTPTGNVVIYAAMAGFHNGVNQGGIYRSIDSGRTWTKMRAGFATDVEFDPNSNVADAFSNPTGNIRTIYGAFEGEGVFSSPNQGQLWNLMAGGVGDPLIQNFNSTTSKFVPIPVNAPAATPNGANGRIDIVHPALITEADGSITPGDAAQNLLYEGWLYALVSTPDGHYGGLYMTKDGGQNWTKVRIANSAGAATSGVTKAIAPTNDITSPDYDIFGGQGNYDMALTIDPNNPNVVYIGGSRDFGPATMIRVDTTFVSDAHSLFSDPTRNGGGVLQSTTDPISIFDVNNLQQVTAFPDPLTNPFLNLLPSTTSGATVSTFDAGTLANTGSGARWTPFISILGGQTDIHRFIAMKDPVSGKTRLIVGLDQGVFSGVDDGTGLNLTSIGTQTVQSGSRNGNLQITQFYNGAAQPSNLAAQIAGAMFYGMAQDNGFPQSSGNVLTTGNLNWTGSTGDGTDAATDAGGSGTLFQYKWPCCGGGTDFFQVDGQGRTNGLIQTTSGTPPPLGGPSDPQWPSLGGFNFAVNPVNQNAIMLGSGAGRLFGTENQGQSWFVLADPNIFDSTVINGLAYGAPDPNGPGTPGALDNYLLAGTSGGHIYVSFTGGASIGGGNAWINISSGITGSVQRIVTDPNRGSHDAYAITNSGVFYNPDTSAANTSWQNITSNLFSLQTNPFGDVNQQQQLMASLSGLVADWRYVVPFDPTNPNGPTHPMLYVSGDGGTVRSTDNGKSWTVFPAAYQSPFTSGLNLTTTAGGYLPNVNITDLDLSIGNVDPTTGRAMAVDPVTGTPSGTNVLVATTYGRGTYAIRLAPIVFNDSVNKVGLSTTLPAPLGSDTGKFNNDGITSQAQPVFSGLSEQSAFGNQVAISLVDVTDPKHPFFLGGYDSSKPTTDASFTNTANQTDPFGKFNVQVNAGAYDAVNHTTDGVRTVAIFATDAAGTQGTPQYVTFTLLTKPPATPAAPVLETASDSGPSNMDGYTNNNKPTFDVTPTVDNSIILLFRKLATDTSYPATPVATVNVPIGLPTVSTAIQDPGPVPDGTYTYMVEIEDLAGNISQPSPDSIPITIDTVKPLAPSAPVLQASSDSGSSNSDGITNVKNPVFTVSNGEAAPTTTNLFRGTLADGSDAVLVASISGIGSIQDPGPVPDGTYYYFAQQTDLAGNIGPFSTVGTKVTIISAIPGAAPTIALLPSDDSGVKGDNKTNVTQPHLFGVAPIPVPPGYSIDLVRVISPGVFQTLTTIADPNTGNYIVQFPSPLDGSGPNGQNYTVFVQVRDVAGNLLPSKQITLTIKTSPPLTPPTLSILASDDTGIQGDGKTTVRRPHLVGTTDPGDVVNILDAAGNVLASTTASTFAQNGHPAGYYSVQLAANLNNGTIPLYAVATDVEGNSTPKPATPSLNLVIYSVADDFDGDGKADQAMYRWDPTVTATGTWFIRPSSGGSPVQVLRGWAGVDIPMPGDYTGAGQALTAVFRPNTDTWYIGTPGSPTIVQLGTPGQSIPVPAAYDSTGRIDIATYDPATQKWNILLNLATPANPTSKLTATFGFSTTDYPVPGDYQGVGYAELAVYRPATGQWYVRDSVTSQPVLLATGIGGKTGDIVVPGDYDGIGRTEPAIYRPSTGQFIIYNLVTHQTETRTLTYPTGISFQAGDIPVPEDYDGDGKVDLAVYRTSTAFYYFNNSSTGLPTSSQQGYAGHDIPPQSPLPYLTNTIKNGSPAIPNQATITPSVKPALAIATTTNVSAATTTTPVPTTTTTVKPAVVTTTTATPATVTKGNIPQIIPPKPLVVVGKSHKPKKATPHKAAKPKLVAAHPAATQANGPQSAQDAAIESLADAFKGLFLS